MANKFRETTLTFKQVSSITAKTYYWIEATKDGLSLVRQVKRLYRLGHSPALIHKVMVSQARLLYPLLLLNWDGVINNILTGKYDEEVGLHLAMRKQQDF